MIVNKPPVASPRYLLPTLVNPVFSPTGNAGTNARPFGKFIDLLIEHHAQLRGTNDLQREMFFASFHVTVKRSLHVRKYGYCGRKELSIFKEHDVNK